MLTTLRFHLLSGRMLSSEKEFKSWQGYTGKAETLYTIDANVNITVTVEIHIAVLPKPKNRMTYNRVTLLPGIYPKAPKSV